ncbi:hypothetical protein PIB30_089309 [Stylosanthes scabra]|uniref:Uncharacterized protein n=1 Tax=Stylosanthes scabra TaxID=79078 RepID=A0ABU6SUC0_9FABA|nr:hypothetical protein [Stylosanthes scabra]
MMNFSLRQLTPRRRRAFAAFRERTSCRATRGAGHAEAAKFHGDVWVVLASALSAPRVTTRLDLSLNAAGGALALGFRLAHPTIHHFPMD